MGRIWIVGVSAALLASIGFAGPATALPALDAASAPNSPNHRAGEGTRITTDKSQFGKVLFDGDRQAIYTFGKESSKTSKCYGVCAKNWPPVLTKGKAIAKGKVDQGMLGTTTRRNGDKQVTYGGKPLYFYAHEGPTQVFCNNVVEYGGLWQSVKPDGNPVS